MRLRYITEDLDYEKIKDKYKDLGGNDKYKIYEILDPEACKYFGGYPQHMRYLDPDKNLYYIIDKLSNKAKYFIITHPKIDIGVNQIIGDVYISETNFSVVDMSNTIMNDFQALTEIPFELIPDLEFVTSPNRIGDGLAIEGNKLLTVDKILKKVIIPNTVTTIGPRAFEDCNNLTSITIPNSVTSISNGAFSGCNNLLNIEFEENSQLIDIGRYAFANCDHLTSISIPNSVKSIGENAFSGCSSILNITIPNNIKSIGGYAFSNCNNLANITILNGVTSIGDFAFYSCYGLTNIKIPHSVKSIGWQAFTNCTNLPSIIIPDSVKSIDESAFKNCEKLKDIYYEGTEEQWRKIKVEERGNDDLLNATIHYK